MTASPNDSRLMEEVLDTRKVCDKTTWTLASRTDGSVQVIYQCYMPVAWFQTMFAQQLEIGRNKDGERLLT
ncbi:hypothetical protein A6J66_020720 [Yersinia enterocolitica]|nr:hypothetical protein A6J66_020720 [Yersinia enterocolitica]